jgi:hypothetical protein
MKDDASPIELGNVTTPSSPSDAPRSEARQANAMRPLVFISHRHHDQEIASAVARWVSSASGNNVEIFQSSDGLKGTEVARSITEQIQRKVADAAVLIAIYTDQDADWAWVMFEMGIAMDPTTPETRVVVLQCGDHFPPVLSEFKRVRVSEESDRISLTRELLTTRFFPTHPDLTLATYSEDYVRMQAAALWTEMKDLVPPTTLPKDWSPHASIKVEIPLAQVGGLQPMDEARLDGLKLPVRERGKVVSEDDTRSVFTLNSLVGQSLADLATALGIQNQATWIESCVDHLTRCLVGHRPTEAMTRVRTTTGVEYQPLVVRTQHKWFDKVARFEVLFIPVTLVTADKLRTSSASTGGRGKARSPKSP